MIAFIILIFGFDLGFILYNEKVKKPVKKEMDFDYVDSLIEKAIKAEIDL